MENKLKKTSVEISNDQEAYEIVYMMFMRKFYFDDNMGTLSPFVNDPISDCVEEFPQICKKFETSEFINRACNVFILECNKPLNPMERGFWEFLINEEKENGLGVKYVKDFFSPIRAKRKIELTTPEEVADAFRIR